LSLQTIQRLCLLKNIFIQMVLVGAGLFHGAPASPA
jgi:hypothetical protein